MKHRYKLRLGRAAFALIIPVFTVLLIVRLAAHEKKYSPEPLEIYTEQQTSVSADSAAGTLTTSAAITTAPPHIAVPECRAAALYSAGDKRYLYTDNINVRTAPASLTKLLTAATALKYVDKNKIFTVGSEQWLVQPYSSLCYLQIGNMLSLEELITGMLMASGNDAAYTIAVSAARELEPDIYMTDDEAVNYFCRLMNELAAEIGMTDSYFVNPDGWDDEMQYTTVSDLIRLSEYVLTIPEIREITGTFQKSVTIYSGEGFTWTNSNLLLDPYSDYYCEYAAGMKTGTTADAGSCLIAVFHKNKRTYISIVVGCDSDSERYELTLKILSRCAPLRY